MARHAEIPPAFLDHLTIERGLSPRTRENYARDLDAFLAVAQGLGAIDPDVRPDDWSGLADRGLVRTYLMTLRRSQRSRVMR